MCVDIWEINCDFDVSEQWKIQGWGKVGLQLVMQVMMIATAFFNCHIFTNVNPLMFTLVFWGRVCDSEKQL